MVIHPPVDTYPRAFFCESWTSLFWATFYRRSVSIHPIICDTCFVFLTQIPRDYNDNKLRHTRKLLQA
jgi:hypothetical protein